MSEDGMRTQLVLRMRCAKCGRVLRFTYDRPARCPEQTDEQEYPDQVVTGAGKVELSAFVHPCAFCYGEAIRPAILISRALDCVAQQEKEVRT